MWLWLCKVKAIYIMDYEIIPCSPKICDWPLNLFWDHFSLHEGKIVGVIMELEVPQRFIFRPTLSAIMVQQVCHYKRQKRSSRCKSQGNMARKKMLGLIFIFFNLILLTKSCFVDKMLLELRGGEGEGEKIKHGKKSKIFRLRRIKKTR
jgi:hypothetical protein